ncbi:hypothetical protein CPB84DRAFT_1826144 [Gymnopilus junonius]|uniref:Uncharacterized protein n=1 Tax=Gymnopilus junonius TaxID=109634 RepID=A0A9P5TKH4_GYMJU|nr:hypothetical protein CPB84DRAFT_1826144 [Gymnopilus junonius]
MGYSRPHLVVRIITPYPCHTPSHSSRHGKIQVQVQHWTLPDVTKSKSDNTKWTLADKTALIAFLHEHRSAGSDGATFKAATFNEAAPVVDAKRTLKAVMATDLIVHYFWNVTPERQDDTNARELCDNNSDC